MRTHLICVRHVKRLLPSGKWAVVVEFPVPRFWGALLSVQQKPVRIELLHILGMIRDPAGLEYLMDAFEDSDASIRQKSAESTLRIAQMSVSREDNNPLVEEALQSLVEKSGDPAIQKQAKTLLSKILH